MINNIVSKCCGKKEKVEEIKGVRSVEGESVILNQVV